MAATAPKAPSSHAATSRWPKRLTIVALFFLSTVICYIDRINVSVAIIPIALNYSGIHLGTVLALLLTPPLILALGWRAVFYLSGALGLLWMVPWMAKATDGPENSPAISAEELKLITADRTPLAKADAIP